MHRTGAIGVCRSSSGEQGGQGHGGGPRTAKRRRGQRTSIPEPHHRHVQAFTAPPSPSFGCVEATVAARRRQVGKIVHGDLYLFYVELLRSDSSGRNAHNEPPRPRTQCKTRLKDHPIDQAVGLATAIANPDRTHSPSPQPALLCCLTHTPASGQEPPQPSSRQIRRTGPWAEQQKDAFSKVAQGHCSCWRQTPLLGKGSGINEL